jgi:protein-S-isoprenylcysteine O-methyltransferase Ste14
MLITLTVAWITYLTLHSALATEWVKKRIPLNPRNYRLWYAVLSTVGLIILFWMVSSIPSPYFFVHDGWVRYVSLMLATFGAMTIQLSFRQYPIKSFLGLADEPKTRLKTTGLLQVVRHPIYAGTILITIGFFLFVPNWPTLISCGSILAYLPMGIYLEEQKLISTYGDEYRMYRKQVPSIIPRWPWMK